MYRILKTLHLIGLALFFGSIAGHVVAAVHAGTPGSPTFLFAREEIVTATRALTLPGLALALVSGVGMILATRLALLRQRWLIAHGIVGVVIAVIAAGVLAPAGRHALALTFDLATDTSEATAYRLGEVLHTESVAGGINILLTIAVILLAIFKPRLNRRGGRCSPQARDQSAAMR